MATTSEQQQGKAVEKQRYRHPSGTAHTQVSLTTMLQSGMLAEGGTAEQFREEYGEWFELLQGGTWRVEAVVAAVRDQPLSDEAKRAAAAAIHTQCVPSEERFEELTPPEQEYLCDLADEVVRAALCPVHPDTEASS
ncbi:MAG TPA: hypothetical protein VFJ76_07935 [Solirubrobacterales bacterium]|nr:hypothetical protein [Solirubrobacterales bacterium]